MVLSLLALRPPAPRSATQGGQLPADGRTTSAYCSTSSVGQQEIPQQTLFDDITAVENARLAVDYRCVFAHNVGTRDLTALLIWFETTTAVGSSVALAVDYTPASSFLSPVWQASVISDEGIAPVSVTPFGTPTSRDTAAVLGTIAQNSVKAFWLRRTALGGPVGAQDGFVLHIEESAGSL